MVLPRRQDFEVLHEEEDFVIVYSRHEWPGPVVIKSAIEVVPPVVRVVVRDSKEQILLKEESRGMGILYQHVGIPDCPIHDMTSGEYWELLAPIVHWEVHEKRVSPYGDKNEAKSKLGALACETAKAFAQEVLGIESAPSVVSLPRNGRSPIFCRIDGESDVQLPTGYFRADSRRLGELLGEDTPDHRVETADIEIAQAQLTE